MLFRLIWLRAKRNGGVSLIRGPLVYCLGTAFLLVAPAGAFSGPQGGGQTPAVVMAPATSISGDAILRFLSEFRHDDVAQGLLIGLIHIYGLSFHPSGEMRSTLEAAGASDALIKSIESARTNSIPVAPSTVGSLAVVCQPLDCEVEVDGKRFGTASSDGLSRLRLPVGTVTVRAKRANYVPDPSEEVVEIRADKTARVEFQFSVNRATLEEVGQRLFHATLASLGSEIASASTMPALRAVGTIYLYSNPEQPSAWSTIATIRGPDSAVFLVSRAGRKYEITSLNGRLTWKHPPKDKETRALEDGLMTAFNYQLTRLTTQLGNPKFTLLGQTAISGEIEPRTFRAQSDAQSYVVRLDSESRPIEIRMESGGLDTSTRVLYSEYVKFGPIALPRNTSIVLPGDRYGIEIRYDQIELMVPTDSSKSGRRPRGKLPHRNPS